MESAPVIILALLGLVLIFSARRSTMPATAKNKRGLGMVMMGLALGIAIYQALEN